MVWDPPSFDGGSEIKRYRIELSSEYHSRVVEEHSATNSRSQVTVTKSGRSSQVFWVPSSETQYTFDDLVEGTKYECKVLAENEAGIGTSSEPITFVASNRDRDPVSDLWSIACGPWGKPGIPRLREIAKDSLTIQWEDLQSWEIDGFAEGTDKHKTHFVVEVRRALVLLYGVIIKVHYIFIILFVK